MGLSRLEQETCITFNRAEDTAWLFTHEPRLWRLMADRGIRPVREDVLEGRIVARAYLVPKSWIRVRPSRKATPAQRAAAQKATRARMAARALAQG